MRFYRRGDDYYVDVDGKSIKVTGLRPIDYLLIALAYGLGTRYLDEYGVNEYVIKCEIEGDNLRCEAPCSGLEDRCFVNRLLTRGGLTLRCLAQ